MLVGNPEISGSVDPALYNWAQQSSQVLFCGYTDAVEQYLSAMDVYILPSYREGFGSGVIEAEVMGVPVIVTDIPGPTNAMVPNVTGLVVPKQDVSALYESMMLLPAQADLCQSFGEAGFRFATEKFEQRALCHHILRDRKRLLGER
jgi:glycosyltransferase involved in cell wall biosynthesis